MFSCVFLIIFIDLGQALEQFPSKKGFVIVLHRLIKTNEDPRFTRLLVLQWIIESSNGAFLVFECSFLFIHVDFSAFIN